MLVTYPSLLHRVNGTALDSYSITSSVSRVHSYHQISFLMVIDNLLDDRRRDEAGIYTFVG